MNLEVPLGAALVVADLSAHALGEDLRASARQRVQPGGHEIAQHLLVGHPVQIGEKGDLDGGETLEVDVRPYSAEALQKIDIVAERQVRVKTVDDVQFGQRLVGARPELVPCLIERHRVGTRVSGLEARERTEETTRHAHVGRLDAQVVVEVGPTGVTLLPITIGQPAE